MTRPNQSNLALEVDDLDQQCLKKGMVKQTKNGLVTKLKTAFASLSGCFILLHCKQAQNLLCQ